MANSLWLLNRSAENLIIPFVDRAGQHQALNLPVTWIPQDVTIQGTKKEITQAPMFRRAEMLKLVTVMSDAEASKILKDREAQIEQDRIYRIHENIKLIGDPSITVSSDTTVIDARNEGEDEIRLHSITSLADHAAQSNRFRTMVNSEIMTGTIAMRLKKWIKQEPDKSKRNRSLWNLAKAFLEGEDE